MVSAVVSLFKPGKPSHIHKVWEGQKKPAGATRFKMKTQWYCTRYICMLTQKPTPLIAHVSTHTPQYVINSFDRSICAPCWLASDLHTITTDAAFKVKKNSFSLEVSFQHHPAPKKNGAIRRCFHLPDRPKAPSSKAKMEDSQPTPGFRFTNG